MLIRCPECGKEISDKSKQCIHCGFPLKELNNEKQITVNYVIYDASALYNIFDSYKNNNIERSEAFKKILNEIYKYNLSPENSCELTNIIFETGVIPKEYNGQTKEEYLKEKNTIRCPKCGSTTISTGQRGYSLLTGFLGSNKTVNRCANCGYKWEPKR